MVKILLEKGSLLFKAKMKPKKEDTNKPYWCPKKPENGKRGHQ